MTGETQMHHSDAQLLAISSATIGTVAQGYPIVPIESPAQGIAHARGRG
jgi:hypothetical protein